MKRIIAVIFIIFIVLNIVVSLPSNTVYSQSSGTIIIDLYSPDSSFNIRDYDIIIGLSNVSGIDGYVLTGMNLGGFLYYLVLNTVQPNNDGLLAPFTIRSVRLLFNKLINRKILEERASSYMGVATTVPAIPGSPSYTIVSDIIRAFRTMDTDELWDRVKTDLSRAGAYYNESTGYWYYNGSIISVRVVYKPMDPRSNMIMDYIVDVIEEMGFKAVVVNASILDYLNYIYRSDPSEHEWDILPMSCIIYPDKYSMLPAYLYSSWGYFLTPPSTYLPRIMGNNSYVNSTIDSIIEDLLQADRGSEKWIEDYRKIVYLGLMESATIPLIYHPVIVAVRNDIIDNIEIDPSYGFFSVERIESGLDLRIAIITSNFFIKETRRFTVYDVPDILPYNILSWYTCSSPLVYDPVYGDLRGYAIKIVNITKIANTSAYILDYAKKEWIETTIQSPSYKVTLDISGLGDPIDNGTNRIFAKALLSIYLGTYISRNPDKFPRIYREYNEALKGFEGLDIQDNYLVVYYFGNKTITEMLYNINTLLGPATHPLGLIMAIIFEEPYVFVPGYSPYLTNLISSSDMDKLAELLYGISNITIYNDYMGLYKLGNNVLIDYDEWNDSLNGVVNWIGKYHHAWICNGRYMITNITETHVELTTQRSSIKPVSRDPWSPPLIETSKLKGLIENKIIKPQIETIITSTMYIDDSYADYVIGYVFVYNKTPIIVDSQLPDAFKAGTNNISYIGNPYMIFSTIMVSIMEYSWRNYTRTMLIYNTPRLEWIDANSTTCTSSLCVYHLLAVQNTSSVLKVVFDNMSLVEHPLGRIYGVAYDVQVNTTGLSDGGYRLNAYLVVNGVELAKEYALISVDIDPPIIQASIDIFANQTIRISWSIEDYSGVRSAELVIRGPKSFYKSIEPNGTINIYLKPGNYTLSIIARDPYGHVATISKTFEIQPSETEITSPNPAPGPGETGFPTYLAIGIVIVVAAFILISYIRRRAKT